MVCRQPQRPQFLRDQRERQAPQPQRRVPQQAPPPLPFLPQGPAGVDTHGPQVAVPAAWAAAAPAGGASGGAAASKLPAPGGGDAVGPGHSAGGGVEASPRGEQGGGKALHAVACMRVDFMLACVSTQDSGADRAALHAIR